MKRSAKIVRVNVTTVTKRNQSTRKKKKNNPKNKKSVLKNKRSSTENQSAASAVRRLKCYPKMKRRKKGKTSLY